MAGTEAAFYFVPYYCALFAFVFYGTGRLMRSWPISRPDRALLSSCFVSLVHGVPAGMLAAQQVYDARPINVAARNGRDHENLLQYTLAYMIIDTVLYLLPYTPTDFIFCVHHLVVIAYVSTTLSLGRGALSCLIMLFLGECTSLLQNSWYICKVLRSHSQLARRVSKPLGVIYPAAYLAARSIVGPPAVLWICKELWRANLPAYCRYTWLAICVISLSGSQLWSFNLVKDLMKPAHSDKTRLAEKLN